MVVQGYEELTETMLTLTFHIATLTLEEMKAKSWILVSQHTENVWRLICATTIANFIC